MSAPDLPPPPSHDVSQRPLHVHLHVSRVSPEALRDGVVVVIDAIRASVTIAQALANGASAIYPALTADDARRLHASLTREFVATGGTGAPTRVLKGGERGGVLIDGFDLDNSPFSYTPERVRDAHIAFTTSNGTAGLLHARHAAKIIVGSMANCSRVCEALSDEPRPVHIVCCGTRDDVSLDDVLAGGAMATQLVAAGRSTSSDDSWSVATSLWQHVSKDGHASVVRAFATSRGGRNMVTLGMMRDVELCATLDTLAVLPVFDASSGAIRLESESAS